MADNLRKLLFNLISIPCYVKPIKLSKKSIFRQDESLSPIKSPKNSELSTSDSSPLKFIKLHSIPTKVGENIKMKLTFNECLEIQNIDVSNNI